MGHVQGDLGHVEGSLAWFERSVVLSRSIGEHFGVRWALCGQLLVAAQAGDTGAADRAEHALAEVVDHPAKLFEIYGRRGAAWNLAGHGNAAQAQAGLLQLAEVLFADGCATHAVRTLVDAACLGAATQAAGLLEHAPDGFDGELMPLLVGLVQAVAAEDAAGVIATADHLAAMDYHALARGASGCARDLLLRAGRSREAEALGARGERRTSNGTAVAGLLFAARGALRAAHLPGAGDRSPRGPGPHQPSGRGGLLPVRAHGRQPPVAHLRQARDPEPHRPGRRAGAHPPRKRVMTTALYDAAGGREAIVLVVDELYDRLMADATLMHHFRPERLPSLKDAQVRWFTAVLCGDEPPGDLHEIHAHLDITDDDVGALIAHLDELLTDLGWDPRVHRAMVALVSRLWHARQF